MECKKKFIIIGNQNAITYKEIFKLLKTNKIWLGNHAGDMKFKVPDSSEPRKTRYWEEENGQKWRSLGSVCWFTNLDIAKRHEDLICYKEFSRKEYSKYENYDAIEVSKKKEIPVNYTGAMGVPITFMQNYNPNQFNIIGLANDKREIHDALVQGKPIHLDEQHKRFVGMVLKKENKLRAPYARIIIKKKT